MIDFKKLTKSIAVLLTICSAIYLSLGSVALAFTQLDVQKGLTYLGYNPGPLDGKIGKKTKKAFRNFWFDTFKKEYTGQFAKHDYQKIGAFLSVKLQQPQKKLYKSLDLPDPSPVFSKFMSIKLAPEFPFTNGSATPAHPKHAYTVQHPFVLDINGDGCSDAIFQFMDSYAHPYILYGQQKLSPKDLKKEDEWPKTKSIRNIKVKDLDGDKKPDFVGFTAPHSLSSDGKFGMGFEKDLVNLSNQGVSLTSLKTYAHTGIIADINGDGITDIFPVNEFPDRKQVALLGDGKGKFDRKYTVKLPFKTVTSDAVSTDLNGDGIDDYVFTSAKDQRFSQYITNKYYENNGSVRIAFGEKGKSINELKFKAYGTHWMSDEHWVAWRLLHKTSDFGYDMGKNQAHTQPSNVNALDFDNDGDLDVLIGFYVASNSSWMTSGFQILENVGGDFVEATEKFVPVQLGNQSLTQPSGFLLHASLVDFNNDGKKDLVLTTSSEQSHNQVSTSLYLNFNGQYFPISADLTRGHGVKVRLHVADFNCDGKNDFMSGDGLHWSFRLR